MKQRKYWQKVLSQIVDGENVIDVLACGHRLLAIRYEDTGRWRKFAQRECWRCRHEAKKAG